MNIRPAQSDDFQKIINLYQEHRADAFNQPERLKDNLTNNPAFIAEQNGKMIGFTYTFTFAPDIIEMQNLYVAQNYRKKGVAQALLHALHNNLKAAGYHGVILSNSTLYETKQPARFAENFYTSCGYVKVAATNGTHVYFKTL